MNRLLFLVVMTLTACGDPPRDAPRSLASALAVDTTGYERALGPIDFSFPADHGAHDDYRLEWWYFTGNLEGENGDRFGYQFTIFRTALTPADSILRTSAWAGRQLYSAHLALTDVAGDAFYHAERFSRAAPGLAGAEADPFRVWIEDWRAEGLGPIRIVAATDSIGLDLTLSPSKPIVLQGDRGYSVKGADGSASYYYAWTRLATTGTVRVPSGSIKVTGLSWFDREWSTSVLARDQLGWDWFSLQLSDGSDLMYFELRGKEGPSHLDGSRVAPDGRKSAFEPTLSVTDTWRSTDSGVVYPAGWHMTAPGLDLSITPLLDRQELILSVRYWEGAVRVVGESAGRPVDGYGYVELTGYGDAP